MKKFGLAMLSTRTLCKGILYEREGQRRDFHSRGIPGEFGELGNSKSGDTIRN